MIKNLKPGDGVWVIDRFDEDDGVVEPTRAMFLAAVADYVIGSAWINGMREVSKTMDYHAVNTKEDYGTSLMVFPACDCFNTEEEACEAIQKERASDE